MKNYFNKNKGLQFPLPQEMYEMAKRELDQQEELVVIYPSNKKELEVIHPLNKITVVDISTNQKLRGKENENFLQKFLNSNFNWKALRN